MKVTPVVDVHNNNNYYIDRLIQNVILKKKKKTLFNIIFVLVTQFIPKLRWKLLKPILKNSRINRFA